MGWKWVLFFCAIFQAIGFVYLFFFMEETNYSRKTITGQESKESKESSGTQTPIMENVAGKETAVGEKTIVETPAQANEEGVGTIAMPTKTYLQKLKLFQPGALAKENQLLGMMMRPLIYMTFPVIFYAGFSYGSNLVSRQSSTLG